MNVTEPQGISGVEENLDPLFLRVCRNEAVETTPLWIMRQAGRYLPEYRRVREEHDFLTVCNTPDLATEVTLQPIRRFDLDASILFSDIMVPVIAMGADITFAPGPVLAEPIRDESAVRALGRPDAADDLGFVMETLRNLRRELPQHVTLIGFSGAPFTLAAYLVEGGASKEFASLKSLMFQEPVTFHLLMEKLALVVVDYMKAQIDAGAQAVQLFDTWAGLLSPADYREYVLPHVQRIVEQVKRPGVPFLMYGNGTGGLLELFEEAGVDIVSLDWRVDMAAARSRISPGIGVQGNLDPIALFAPPETMPLRVRNILEGAGTESPHIFNLGHGISRHTPIEGVEALVRAVHDEGRRIRREAADAIGNS